eukprot:gene3679-4102_t
MVKSGGRAQKFAQMKKILNKKAEKERDKKLAAKHKKREHEDDAAEEFAKKKI